MNAIISLSHFCDKHGSAIIFNTQTFKDLAEKTSPISKKSKNWKYGYIADLNKQFLPSVDCGLCRSIPGNKVSFVSNVEDKKISLVSSRAPLQKECLMDVRQVFLRAFSCEKIIPKDEGVIYFGDKDRGHAISFAFVLKDYNARGKQRKCCLSVFMRDELYLLNSWDFFIESFTNIIEDMQTQSNEVFTEEASSANSPGLHITGDVNRSLVQIMECPDFWSRLHYKFCWILRAGNQRMVESIFYGDCLNFKPANRNDFVLLMTMINSISLEDLRKILHTLYMGNDLIMDRDSCISPIKMCTAFQLLVPDKFNENIKIANVNDELTRDICNEKIVRKGSDLPHTFKMGLTATRSNLHSINESGSIHSIQVEMTKHIIENYKPPQIVDDIVRIIQKRDLSTFSRDITLIIDDWKQKARLWAIARMTMGVHKSQDEKLSHYRNFLMAWNLPVVALEEKIKPSIDKYLRLPIIDASKNDEILLSKWAYLFEFSLVPTPEL